MDLTKTSWRTATGFAYGVGLFVFSFFLTGLGHGTFLPAMISSAPFSALHFMLYLATPLFWAFVFRLARSASSRKFFVIAMLMHYAGVIISFFMMEQFDDDWHSVAKAANALGEVMLIWIAMYMIGQAVLWHWFIEES